MVISVVWSLAVSWRTAKDAIESAVPISTVGLHLLTGVAIFFLVGLAARGRLRWMFAWGVVLIAAVGNELVDISTERWPDINQQYAEAGIDLVATMAVPTLMAIVRFVLWRGETQTIR